MFEKFYLGLDIGDDSIGYAVTDENYRLLKKFGEPMWGVSLFDAGQTAEERRLFRSARRRIDRRQQRVNLVNEIFAPEVAKIDPDFFIRRQLSALCREDASVPAVLFSGGGITDRSYHRQYPTIHHLLLDLMQNPVPHDVRLVCMACDWLVAHRGHFALDLDVDDISSVLSFERVVACLQNYLKSIGASLPWDEDVPSTAVADAMQQNSVSLRQTAFSKNVLKGCRVSSALSEDCPYNHAAVIDLLCGKTVKPADLFGQPQLNDLDPVSLTMPDEAFDDIVNALGSDGEFLVRLRALQDCALLRHAQHGYANISEAKIAVYNQHLADLKALKIFVKKYIPQKYNAIFRYAAADNYVAYSYNVKSCKHPQQVKAKASAEAFSAFLKRTMRDVIPQPEDQVFYDDMMARLDALTFLPRQKDPSNRVIPMQLYRYEYLTILENAKTYLPFLNEKDETGLTAAQKLLSIFDFRVPYYVGPTGGNSKSSWIVRKAEGSLRPWNFDKKVDLDASETAFIQRLTNCCAYLAGENVLPAKSLLYQRFQVLSQLNALRLNSEPLPVKAKQAVYDKIYHQAGPVSVRSLRSFLQKQGVLLPGDELTIPSGRLTASLSSEAAFRSQLTAGTLNENDVERIITHAACSRDRARLTAWISREFPQLSDNETKAIVRQDFSGFGRLSHAFLQQLTGADCSTGETFTIMEALYGTPCTLNELLSDRFTFADAVRKRNREYYEDHPQSLTQRLDEMHVSNAMKRPICRALDLCADVVRAMGREPERIFISTARAALTGQGSQSKGTRHQQLCSLYRLLKTDEARRMMAELSRLGDLADTRLQSDRLFLWFMQLGRCAYCGEPIALEQLETEEVNIEHIWPRALVKDDSVENNLVLVKADLNSLKGSEYPLPSVIQSNMRLVWLQWRHLGLLSVEKYQRLIRTDLFTDQEKWGFIRRGSVELKYPAGVIAELLEERFPKSEILPVKAGLVNEFRQCFDQLQPRDMPARFVKDAYLTIVTGSVTSARFDPRHFTPGQPYSIKTTAVFNHPVEGQSQPVWHGTEDIEKVTRVLGNNAIHVTKFPTMRAGGLFDQQPVKKGAGLVPRKAGLPTQKYGGYNKSSSAFYTLARFTTDKKTDVAFLPVELCVAKQFLSDADFAQQYVMSLIPQIWKVEAQSADILLDHRPIKINTCIEADGLRLALRGKASGGKTMHVSLLTPAIFGRASEHYIQRLQTFAAKQADNRLIRLDEAHDHITAEENLQLYDCFLHKMQTRPFDRCPGCMEEAIYFGRDRFISLPVEFQVRQLLDIYSWFGGLSPRIDLSAIGGCKNSGAKTPASVLSSWAKHYNEVRLIDTSPSGIFETASQNLLNYL